jgi:DNA-binding MarR family transcriptional regulator
MTIGDLADELHIRHNSAVGLVDRLENSELMIRDNSPAGRTVVLSLTSKAETVLANLAEVHLMELRRYAPAIVQLFSEPLETAKNPKRRPRVSASSRR